MQFDLHNPKIVLGLLLGMMVPYVLPAVLATPLKWGIFVVIFGQTPRISTLLIVAVAEVACLFVALWAATCLGISPRLSFAAYPLLAAFPNLLLFRAVNHRYANSLMKRFLCAFAAGSLYLPCLIAVLLVLRAWWVRL